jgi:maltooligosyltrehalose trehalohydrolase
MKGEDWRLSFGANLLTPDSTLFRVWAPGQPSLELLIDGHGTLPMIRNEDGSFQATVECGAGTRYRYRLPDGRAIADPASRAQSGDVHGASIVVDPTAYTWRNADWRGRPWHHAIIYEMHTGIYGGFSGVASELPRLAALGVTAVELMPIAEFPGARNWGYDGALLFAPESSYGKPDDLKALIDTAHDYRVMVYLDVVYNHFGPDGNYLAALAPQMFRSDVNTPWGPAIDFRQRQVRQFFAANALYWLIEYRFDGLRFDAVHAITEADWLDEMAEEVRRRIPDRDIHLVLENDDNTASHLAGAFDAQWNDDGHHVLHRLLTGEYHGYYADYAKKPAALLARSLKEGFVYQGEPSAHRGGQRRGTPSAYLPPTAFVLFLQNHDQIGNRAFGERLTTLADPAALEAAIALQLLCPQIPLIFMGEESGSTTPFLFFTDHGADLGQAVREGRRREFASFPQFSDPDLLHSIPDPNAVETFVRSKPLLDTARDGRQQLYHQLIAIRRSQIIPRLAGARALDATVVGDDAVTARWRMGDGATLWLACNLGQHEATIEPPRGAGLFASSKKANQAAARGRLCAYTTIAFLDPE